MFRPENAGCIFAAKGFEIVVNAWTCSIFAASSSNRAGTIGCQS